MKYQIERVRPKIQIFKDNAMFCHDSFCGQFNLKLDICHLLLQVKRAGTLFLIILGQHMHKPTVRTLCRPILLEAKQKFCGLASNGWLPVSHLGTLQNGGHRLPNCYYFCSLISARTNWIVCFFFWWSTENHSNINCFTDFSKLLE